MSEKEVKIARVGRRCAACGGSLKLNSVVVEVKKDGVTTYRHKGICPAQVKQAA